MKPVGSATLGSLASHLVAGVAGPSALLCARIAKVDGRTPLQRCWVSMDSPCTFWESEHYMRKANPWRKLWLIALALLVVPPLGLFVLWRSPRERRVKIVVSTILAFLIAGVVVGAARTHDRWAGKRVPEYDYDVTMNSRNRYRTPEILSQERLIFNEVVQETRRSRVNSFMDAYTAEGPNVTQPQTRAFAIVAKRRGLDPDVVAAIYRKVSSQLVPRGR